MIGVTVVGDLGQLIRAIERITRPDLAPLGAEARRLMIQDNRNGLVTGRDRDGDRVAPLADSTLRRGRAGDGEALVPREDGSRMIAGYQVDMQESPDSILLVGSWPGVPFVRYHQSGTRFMPARNPVGIRPSTRGQLAAAIHDFALGLVGQR
jgi:hypothetical protein